jgi:hypothetical protein
MTNQAGTGEGPLSVERTSNPTEELMPVLYGSVPLDCEICQHIMRAFHTAFEDLYEVDFGIAADALSKACLV